MADIAVHNPRHQDGEERPHAHVMLTMRELTGEGFGPKNREWNRTDVLEGWRERWAEHANRALERSGHDARIDHRSYADQGVDREPQPKLGAAAAMERRGEITERGDELRQVEARNAERSALARQMEAIREAFVEWRERTTEAWHRGADAAREAYDAVKERVNSLLGRAGDQTPAVRSPDLDRDAMLGRSGETTERAPKAAVDRAALLGQAGREAADKTVSREALLGRGLPEPDRECVDEKRDGVDRGR